METYISKYDIEMFMDEPKKASMLISNLGKNECIRKKIRQVRVMCYQRKIEHKVEHIKTVNHICLEDVLKYLEGKVNDDTNKNNRPKYKRLLEVFRRVK